MHQIGMYRNKFLETRRAYMSRDMSKEDIIKENLAELETQDSNRENFTFQSK